MAIHRYYMDRSDPNKKSGRMAQPKILIDLALMERYHWTPQQIDEIPNKTMEMIMLALNQEEESKHTVEKLKEINSGAGIGNDNGPKVIGRGGIKKRINV